MVVTEKVKTDNICKYRPIFSQCIIPEIVPLEASTFTLNKWEAEIKT